MLKRTAIFVAAVFAVCVFMGAGCEPKDKPRTFTMGFTQRPYDDGIEALQDTFARIRLHSDLAAFHLDEGVPWVEAAAGTLYVGEFEGYLGLLVDQSDGFEEVYVGVSSLDASRRAMAPYRGVTGNMDLPAPWDSYTYSDEPVIAAYTAYCVELIRRFQPTYFNYGIEANGLLLQNPNLWDTYVIFLKAVYTRIKAVYPEVLVGLSVTLRHPDAAESALTRQEFAELVPYFDFLAASVYPYVYYGGLDAGDPTQLQKGWLLQIKDIARGKPVAIGETGWIAENLDISTFGVSVVGTPERQDNYVKRLMGAASDVNALFVVWWTIADFDALWEKLPPDSQDVGKIARDTGLYDGTVTPRPSLTMWDLWLAKEIRAGL